MKAFNSMLRDAGISQKGADIIAVIITVVVTGITAFTYIWDTIKGIPLPYWVLVILGAIATSAGGYFVAQHTTNTINGTAAATANQTAAASNQAAEITASQLATAIQGVLASQKQADSHAQAMLEATTNAAPATSGPALLSTVETNTVAVKENTATTAKNTEVMKEEGTNRNG